MVMVSEGEEEIGELWFRVTAGEGTLGAVNARFVRVFRSAIDETESDFPVEVELGLETEYLEGEREYIEKKR